MKTKGLLLLLLISGFLSSSLIAQSPVEKEPRTFEIQEGDTTYTMKRYVMVFLMRGDKAMEFSEKELEELQAGHMANMSKMEEAGKLVVAGPFGDDTEFRGILIMDTETIEEAREMVEMDPAIKAGRMRAEFHPWWGAVGTTLK